LATRWRTPAPKIILTGVNRSVQGGQRIGILGANGQGKSTLVKTIAREMAPLAGTVTEGKGLNIGYFAQQELDVLRPQDNPLEHMVRLARELGTAVKESTGEQDLRNFLGSFNFSGDMVKQPVGTMSGGEKARLVLAMMVWQRPNLLLLDEPTNHLDLATREALAVALNEFEGTLMLVSHDRALLRSVCDEFWLVGRGVVTDFDGDLDDYQRYLLDEAKRMREEAKEAAQAAQSASRRWAPRRLRSKRAWPARASRRRRWPRQAAASRRCSCSWTRPKHGGWNCRNKSSRRWPERHASKRHPHCAEGHPPERPVSGYSAVFHPLPGAPSMMSILGTIVIGLIVGFIARAIKPGDDKLGWIMTAVLGIAGSFLATYAGQAMGLYKAGATAGWIASVVGAVVLLVIYSLIKKKA
jgi:ABC-type Mn2+/Zn2+ transport system ATPase subunit/uncharacterized membrane protein YeaQ/YmgE (transglycosylase-associated protein family)